MKMLHYELWFYDVWGNREDGFEVNDSHCANRDFIILSSCKTYNKGTPGEFLDYTPSGKEILKALVDAGQLNESALTRHIEIDGNLEYLYLTDLDAGYYPLCELCLVDKT